jgi:hypothetical protein
MLKSKRLPSLNPGTGRLIERTYLWNGAADIDVHVDTLCDGLTVDLYLEAAITECGDNSVNGLWKWFVVMVRGLKPVDFQEHVRYRRVSAECANVE